jgi:hypothetical protein
VQVRVNTVVAVRLPVLCVPAVALVPDHPPEAVHELALVELHVSVAELPEVTEVRLVDKLTVGVGAVAVGTVAEPECLYK